MFAIRRLLPLLALAFALAGGSAALASPTTCPRSYLDGVAPDIADPALASPGREFCYTIFAVSYSTTLRNPLWSAEHLTKAIAMGGDHMGRKDRFHRETLLTRDQQATYDEISGPEYDSGHMTPSDDAPDMDAQYETFVMTNMVAQRAALNRRLWQYLEASLNRLAELEGDIYIITGPVFRADPPVIAGRIAVPTYTFKAVYVPRTGVAIGYLATNTTTPTCKVVSIAELTQLSGIDPFPSLPASVKAAHPTLQLPRGVRYPNGRPARVALPNCG